MEKDKFKISFSEATAAAFKSVYADKHENVVRATQNGTDFWVG
jgi:hypothetical protein